MSTEVQKFVTMLNEELSKQVIIVFGYIYSLWHHEQILYNLKFLCVTLKILIESIHTNLFSHVNHLIQPSNYTLTEKHNY